MKETPRWVAVILADGTARVVGPLSEERAEDVKNLAANYDLDYFDATLSTFKHFTLSDQGI